MSLRIMLRSGSLSEWAAAQSAGNGKLRKGEIGVGWIEVGGSITEVVMRIGPHATPTAFSACPVITRSPLTAIGGNIKIPVVDVTNKTDAIVTLSGGSFSAVADDPGTYDSTDDGGGGPISPSETPPAITSVSLARGSTTIAQNGTINLSHDGSVSDMTLTVVATGLPAPTVTAVMETTSGAVNLTGGLTGPAPELDGSWTFPVPLSSTATGLHVITITADSTVQPDAVSTRSFTVARAPAPPVATIAITSLQLKNNATDAVVTNAANGSGITLRADVTTNPTPATTTTYQWRRGQAAISGATSQTYALVSADNDSNVSCAVTVTNVVSGVTATATASASVAVGTVESGWTPLSPSSDSRLIYVAPDGNDATAATAKGRGYYLPGDPEIGPDPTNPVGPIVAYATHFEAAKRVRLSRATGQDANGFPTYAGSTSGFPDWVLLKRGGTYASNPSLAHPNDGVVRDYNLGMLLGGLFQPGEGWNQARGKMWYDCGPWRGRSASEPAVVTAWGPVADPRPIVVGFTIGGGTKHARVVSLDLGSTSFNWGWSGDGFTAGDVLIEDCVARGMGGNNLQQMNLEDGLKIRRSVVSGAFSSASHMQGFFVAGGEHLITIEECVFDRNGYKEDPSLPQTWTAGAVSTLSIGALPAGTGVQPTRTYFDRNLYISSYADVKLRGCIISRGGGGSSVQMREGGVAERNLFLWNEQALGIGHPQAVTDRVRSSLIRQNVVLHDDCFLPPGGNGIGLSTSGTTDDVAVVDDNVVAHFHRSTNGGESINVTGKPAYNAGSQNGSALMRSVVKDNAIFQQNGAGGIVVERSSSPTFPYVVLDADVTGNEVSATRLLSGQGDGTKPAAYSYSGNKFHSTGSSATWFLKQWTGQDYRFFPTYVDLAGWKAAGFDADVSAVSTDLAAFKTAVGWTAPERDILTYMQSVDPSYVVNEDVYVDDDSTGPKQATRQKVWQVLQAGIPGGLAGMSESHAKLTARRYHAFITFIQRAKANRKGAWDFRYTAEAVNNYVREGFGKPPVSGAYTGTLASVGAYS